MLGTLRRCVRAALRPLRSRRGQIAIPSLFVIPSLFLFVYLIYETSKLSREKIRHQFALDAAAFIEMTNYSDFLNRSAYVNGAFPERIFHEGFHGTCFEKKNATSGNCAGRGDRLFTILYDNGAFPARSRDPGTELSGMDDMSSWLIRFGGTGSGKNSNPPSMPTTQYTTTLQDALDYWLSWDAAQDIYKLYVQIYQLLGSVEDAQYSVFCRLTGAPGCGSTGNAHTFFRKSYWLNTNDDIELANEGAGYFNANTFKPKAYCVQSVMLVGNKPTNNPFQPYQQYGPRNPVTMPDSAPSMDCGGLFQVVAMPQSQIDYLNTAHSPGSRFGGAHPGLPVFQHWGADTVNNNYFNVNFMSEVPCPGAGQGPCVHATISVGGGKLWPSPTPKFQTRLYP
ncbi:TadE/TadG family type IV pilus assembly protein [Elusimicrobiota bacterium]